MLYYNGNVHAGLGNAVQCYRCSLPLKGNVILDMFYTLYHHGWERILLQFGLSERWWPIPSQKMVDTQVFYEKWNNNHWRLQFMDSISPSHFSDECTQVIMLSAHQLALFILKKKTYQAGMIYLCCIPILSIPNKFTQAILFPVYCIDPSISDVHTEVSWSLSRILSFRLEVWNSFFSGCIACFWV